MEVFFYGLFMNLNILSEQGITYSNPRKAILNDYALKIGNRASLIPSLNEKAYGIVMTVVQGEMSKLYSEESVADYVPEEVKVNTELNETIRRLNIPL